MEGDSRQQTEEAFLETWKKPHKVYHFVYSSITSTSIKTNVLKDKTDCVK